MSAFISIIVHRALSHLTKEVKILKSYKMKKLLYLFQGVKISYLRIYDVNLKGLRYRT